MRYDGTHHAMPPALSRRELIRGLGAGAVVAALGGLLAGCGRGASAAGGGTASRRASVVITMTDDARFAPASVTVAPGTTITWENASAMQHNVSTDPRKALDQAHAVVPAGVSPWDSGLLDPGQYWSRTFDVLGTYVYYCQPHEALGMIGRITVTG
ncbi:MAG TPA: plastocyanin/azurin family copper-binding protein [Thermomicrobiales bacterium]|nr:plastocyanin/azurin family copper-binding protein [Thermomicrobiales bacterium]